jgi:hypothetical protein
MGYHSAMPLDSPTHTDSISLQTPTGALFGTLIAAGKTAALLIAGSGPTDRDGNSALNLRSNVYKLLAEGLAAKGISTLRYDKRGVGASQGALTADRTCVFRLMWTMRYCGLTSLRYATVSNASGSLDIAKAR